MSVTVDVVPDLIAMDDPLVVAAWLGEDGNVRPLMRDTVDPATVGAALLAAGQAGHQKVVETLLKCKAEVNSKASAQTLEIFVHQQERLEVVPMFLTFGLSPQSKTAGGVFEFAAEKGKAAGNRITRMLLDKGLRADSEAGFRGLQLASQAGHEDIVNMILEAKADPGSRDGGLALREAAIMGQVKVAHALLKAGAVASSEEGNEALKCAVKINSNTMIKLLLVANSDPSYALPMAAFRSNEKLVKLLLELKADAKAKRKALKEAARFGHEKVLSLLLDEGTENLCREGEAAFRMTASALKMNCEAPKMLEKKAGVLEILDMYGTRRLLPKLIEPPPISPCSRTATPLVLSPKEKEAPRWYSPGAFGLRSRARSSPSLHGRTNMRRTM